MGKIFDEVLTQAEELQKLDNYDRASKLLDDLGTAYINGFEFNGLDKSLIAVRTGKKALRMRGTQAQLVDDFMLERSTLSKTQIKRFLNESLYSTPECQELQAPHIKNNEVDQVISEIESRPYLITCLQAGHSRQYIEQTFNLKGVVELQNFYKKHQSIIG